MPTSYGVVWLIDAEAERGAYIIEMRSLWGFDAQVASGKLRECAGCAPQGDTQIDTLASLSRPASHPQAGSGINPLHPTLKTAEG